MKQLKIFEDEVEPRSEVEEPIHEAPSSLPMITVIAHCPICEGTLKIKSPYIFTNDQMIERGWKETKKNVWFVTAACSRACTEKVSKSENL